MVDSDFRGELKVLLFNFGTRAFVVSRGSPVAQLICEQCLLPVVREIHLRSSLWVSTLAMVICKNLRNRGLFAREKSLIQDTTSPRGSGGFGSTTSQGRASGPPGLSAPVASSSEWMAGNALDWMEESSQSPERGPTSEQRATPIGDQWPADGWDVV